MLNLPIKIIEQKDEFDLNSPTIIMLCGQGSSGKTTFWRQYLSTKTVVSIDGIVGESNFEDNIELYLLKFANQIRLSTDKNEDTVLDFSHDTVKERMKSLIHISSPYNYNLLVISMSLDFPTLIKNDLQRKGLKTLSNESLLNMLNIYNNFIPPTIAEFEKYNFKSIVIAEHKQI